MSFLSPKLGLITVKEKRNLKARFTRPGGISTSPCFAFARQIGGGDSDNNISTHFLSPSSLGLN
jgi:hypothetical protein